MAFEKLTPEELKARLSSEELHGIALDIDDTLSLTSTEWYVWMDERFRNPEGLSPADIHKQYRSGISSVPYWQSQEAAAFMKDLLVSEGFHDAFSLIQGADTAVREINDVIPVVAYITARPDAVYESTKRWLIRHGFPEAPIIFRPVETPIDQRSTWKAGVLVALHPWVEGIIDDHPSLFSELARLEYPGKLYLCDHGSTHNDYTGLDALGGWDVLIRRIKEDFPS